MPIAHTIDRISDEDGGQTVIRLSKSSVGKEEQDALARVIDAGYLGMGADVQHFEEELRSYIGTDKEVICVNTGTAALHLSLECLGIGPGDEVLVPTITYLASFQAVSATGAKPVACDVTADRVFLDVHDAEKRITDHTKAIMPVHYASDSTLMGDVYRLAERYGLRVIEDAAHAFGCTREGRMIGTDGDVICFSFDGIKNITSGEGGAIVTGDSLLAQRIRDARLLGVEKDTEKRYSGDRSWSFDVRHQGYRYHMSNLMAAIGRTQLRKVDFFACQRKCCVERYLVELSDIPEVQLLDLQYDALISHIFPVRIKVGQRDGLMNHLRACSIECGIHYQPNHLLSLYANGVRLPVAECLAGELLSLPLHPELTESEQDRVIYTLRNYLAGACNA